MGIPDGALRRRFAKFHGLDFAECGVQYHLQKARLIFFQAAATHGIDSVAHC